MIKLIKFQGINKFTPEWTVNVKRFKTHVVSEYTHGSFNCPMLYIDLGFKPCHNIDLCFNLHHSFIFTEYKNLENFTSRLDHFLSSNDGKIFYITDSKEMIEDYRINGNPQMYWHVVNPQTALTYQDQ